MTNTARKSGTWGQIVQATADAATHVAVGPQIPVTPGTTYVATVPLTLMTAKAGVTATVGIDWFDASGGWIHRNEAPATPTRNAVSFSQNWPAQSDVAPPTAKTGSIWISFSGLAVGDRILIDDAEMRVAPLIPGNLFSFADQSFETGLAGWTVTGAAFDATTGSVGDVGTGYRVGLGQSTAATVVLENQNRPAVTPGVEYVSYTRTLALAPVNLTAELEWYDGDGQVIAGATNTCTRDVGASERYLLPVVGTAPANAETVKLRITFGGMPTGTTCGLDEASLKVAPNKPDNVLTYDEYSFESLVPPITVENATWVHNYLSGGYANGTYGLKLTPSATGLITWTLDRLVPVTPGKTYAVEGVMWRDTDSTGIVEWSRRVRVDWYDAAGNLVAADQPDAFYPSRVSGTGLIGGPISATRVCPAGATRAKVGVEIMHSDGAVIAYFLDGVALYESTVEYTLTAENATGCVNFTIYYAPTEYPDAQYLSVYRYDTDGSVTPVRWYGTEFVRVPYTGSPVVIEDYECPIGARVWYWAQWSRANGTTVVNVLTSLVRGPVITDPDYIWLKSPGIPALSRLVMPEAPLAWSRAARSVSYDIVGRRNPISISSRRAGRVGSLTLLTWDTSTADALDALLDSGLPCLIQAAPGLGVSGNLYVRVGDASVEPVSTYARDEARRWVLEIGEIDRPRGGIQGSAGRTWDDVEDLETWSDVNDGYADWAGVLTNVPREG
ncbi:hypothetical protein E0L36_26645 [Streptomyces sp. AJS327]|nr:hypothetical protein [Streptomyces sp. AJS327]